MKPKYVLLLIVVLSNHLQAQNGVEHHDWADKSGGHVVTVHETHCREVTEKPGNPGGKDNPETQYHQPSDRPLPQSIVPLGYPDGMSPSHKSSLLAFNNLLKSISGIKTILAGSPFLDFASDNPKEVFGAVGLRIWNE